MLKILPYKPGFEEGIKALCRIPVSGNISLALEREPSYLKGAHIQCESPKIYVVIDGETSKVWAVFNVGSRRLWYQNQIMSARYLCDLRIHPKKQQGSILYMIIKKFRELTAKDLLPAQTVVFADNHKMLAIIEKLTQRKRASQLPYYHFIGGLVTYMFGFNPQKEKKGNLTIRQAKDGDIETIQAFFDEESPKTNFYPYYNFRELDKSYYSDLNINDFFLAFEETELVGVCGIWNQKEIKQTRILGYSNLYKLLKPIYNLLAPVFGNIKLPAKGSTLNYLNLHSVLIKEKNPAVFQKLVNRIEYVYKDQGYDYMLCSFSEEDPLTQVLTAKRHARKIKGNYYLVNDGVTIVDDLKSKDFYLEGARI
ncbi:MAG: hypothetical protein ACQETL_04725 [Bacteroidota bacterium]